MKGAGGEQPLIGSLTVRHFLSYLFGSFISQAPLMEGRQVKAALLSSLQTHVPNLIPSPQAADSLTQDPLHVLISMPQRIDFTQSF